MQRVFRDRGAAGKVEVAPSEEDTGDIWDIPWGRRFLAAMLLQPRMLFGFPVTHRPAPGRGRLTER